MPIVSVFANLPGYIDEKSTANIEMQVCIMIKALKFSRNNFSLSLVQSNLIDDFTGENNTNVKAAPINKIMDIIYIQDGYSTAPSCGIMNIRNSKMNLDRCDTGIVNLDLHAIRNKKEK